MAKRPGTRKQTQADLVSYLSSPEAGGRELAQSERERFDALGIIGAQELDANGFYSTLVPGTRKAAPRPPAESTILVVEDDAGTAAIIQRVLGSAGYKTRAAATRAQIAEELYRSPLPDLILLDVMLAPGYTGFGILDKLKQHPDLKEIPVVILSSMSSREHVAKGLGLGADGYLTKPARPSVLVDAVRAILARAQ